MIKKSETMSSNERAFFDGIESQKRSGEKSAQRHADTLAEHSNRSQTMRDLLKRDEFKGMSQSEIADLITQSMKAMAAALRKK